MKIVATTFEYILSLKDKASAAIKQFEASVDVANKVINKTTTAATKMEQKAAIAFGRLTQKAITAIKGPKYLTQSIDELEEQLKELNKVHFSTKLKSEFDKTEKEIDKLELLRQKMNLVRFSEKMVFIFLKIQLAVRLIK